MKTLVPRLLLGIVGLACIGCGRSDVEVITKEVTQTEYQPPPPTKDDEELKDDRLADKPEVFDPKVVDRRPFDGWLVNASAAVIKLDIVAVKPDSEADLFKLHPSYAAALKAAEKFQGRTVLPSVNLIDGRAKQFDDGLYAAVDLAYYQGQLGKLRSHVELVRRLYEKLDRKSDAAAFVAAGLSLAGVKVEADQEAKDRYLRQFLDDEVASKPVSFYAENKELSQCFRFLRFFMQQFATTDAIPFPLATVVIGNNSVPLKLASVLAGDEELRADYQRMVDFYGKLSNPSRCFSLTNMTPGKRGPRIIQETVAFLPPSGTREQVLFEKLFPLGWPASADLMGELLRKIRSGEVKLAPAADSGWYEYQVHALETLLLPEKGEESAHLLLTRTYKKRMQEAFKVLMTKRLETHARQISPLHMGATAAPPRPPKTLKPRLRVEPNPTFFLRTARAYAFLANFLESAVGKEGLENLHVAGTANAVGLERPKPANLHADLQHMKDLFYGLYLVSSEDIGNKPAFLPAEPVDVERCYKIAVTYLEGALADLPNEKDTRIVVTLAVDTNRNVSRLWAVLGTRLVKLDATYARAPRLKPKDGEGDWQRYDEFKLAAAEYLIAVDDFAEIEVPGKRTFTRAEWRALCDRGQTRDGILAAVKKAPR